MENKYGAEKKGNLWLIKAGGLTVLAGDDWYKDYVKLLKKLKI